MLRTNALDLGLCALPVEDPAFEVTPLFKDELVAILPSGMKRIPNKVTPAFLSQNPLILGNVNSALRRMVTGWLGAAGTSPKPLMEFDNVEAIKSVVAVGLGGLDRSKPLPGRGPRLQLKHDRQAAQSKRSARGWIGEATGQAEYRSDEARCGSNSHLAQARLEPPGAPPLQRPKGLRDGGRAVPQKAKIRTAT
jgi:DNA-binding transcriptional LysR family regulator